MSMKPIVGIFAIASHEQLSYIREMGIEYVEVTGREEDCTAEKLQALSEQLAGYGLKISIVSCMTLQKNDIIDLNLTEKKGVPVSRDAEIERFIQLVRNCAAVGVKTVSVAWQPTGIKRTGFGVGKFTRGGTAMLCEQDKLLQMPNDYNREYTEAEIWENFAYFIEKITPVCVECGVRIALHPNDPPLPSLCGVGSLIWNMDGYRRAFAMDPAGIIGCKLCIGCWLEGGEGFGDLLSDIRKLQEQNRLVCVHYRNVTSTLPDFEEVLIEDGYADMYEIMKQLVVCGYEGPISIDHAFGGYEATGGRLGSQAYPTGYMKGMLHAIEAELKRTGKN